MSRRPSETGQAAVETVALLPLLVLLAAGLWQLALAGHARWAVAGAARAAARASALGADPVDAARSRLPRSLERGLRVERRGDGRVALSVRIPRAPGIPSLGRLHAESQFGEQR